MQSRVKRVGPAQLYVLYTSSIACLNDDVTHTFTLYLPLTRSSTQDDHRPRNTHYASHSRQVPPRPGVDPSLASLQSPLAIPPALV